MRGVSTATVKFRIVRRETATCGECKELFTPLPNGAFEVSPHLRSEHGFVGKIEFVVTSEVICPPMIYMEARGKVRRVS